MKLEKEKKYWLWCGAKDGKSIQATYLYDNGEFYVFTANDRLFKTPKDEIELVCVENTQARCITKKIKMIREQIQTLVEAFHKKESKYFEDDNRDGWIKAYNAMKKESAGLAKEIERLRKMRTQAKRCRL